ncbi:MAG: M23 family metallopeptidase [Treponema sp.]|nr:M23 family metallopeptidase [Treponema sp.]
MDNITKRSVICSLAICSILVCCGLLTYTFLQYGKSHAQGRGGLETPGPGFESLTSVDIEESKDFSDSFSDVALTLSYRSYRVEKGDMIGILAERFGVTQDTIISLNNIRQSRLLQVGQYLKIPNMAGILYTVKEDGETIDKIAEAYKVDAAKCASVNHKEVAVALKAGDSLFVPDAELDWVTRQEINGDLFTIPIHRSYYLSSRFGWRSSPFTSKRSYHSGIDLACPQGTPIYAALSGKVVSTGFNATYGNFVIIAHHSGYKTLYGHMSAIIAKNGAYVTPGSIIGRVGSTGLSTGPHLHFTVYKNGKTVNPLNLVK